MRGINYIDLFAGAGGLSEGFTRQGFTPVAHVEADGAACYTLKTRAAFHYLCNEDEIDLYHDYVQGIIDRDEFYSCIPDHILDTVINAKIGSDNKMIFRKIDELLDGRPVDLIIGGPPCQAYSIVGVPALKHKKKDERKTLYRHYGRFLKKYRPSMFVFENVPGLLSAAGGMYFKNLQRYYRSLGYEVEASKMDAYDYGVVQRRQRIIIIGWRKDKALSYPDFTKEKKYYTRDDIFFDLPAIGPSEGSRVHKYSAPTNAYLQKTRIRNGVDFVSQHITRPQNSDDLKIYRLAIQYLEKGDRLKNDQIPMKLRTQKNVSSFLDRFKVVGQQPHTMIAHISKDGHHFIHPDVNQLRSISIREAARIQSFPDDFFFEGPKEDQIRSAAFKQIGNAVPPLMAERIAEKIKEMIRHGA